VPAPQRFQVRVGDQVHEVRIEAGPPTRVFVDEIEHEVLEGPGGRALVREPGQTRQFSIVLDEDARPTQATLRGHRYDLEVQTAQEAALAAALLEGSEAAGSGRLEAPMPGRVVKVLIAEGEEVERGAPAVIVEAMKMENELHAPISGTVKSVAVGEGAVVESGALLCVIEAHEEA
jgi:biotin carboxyl carrier protein